MKSSLKDGDVKSTTYNIHDYNGIITEMSNCDDYVVGEFVSVKSSRYKFDLSFLSYQSNELEVLSEIVNKYSSNAGIIIK